MMLPADLVMRLPSRLWKSRASKSWTLPGLRLARISFMKHSGKEAAAFYSAHGGR